MVDAAGFAPAFSCLRGRRLPARLHARRSGSRGRLRSCTPGFRARCATGCATRESGGRGEIRSRSSGGPTHVHAGGSRFRDGCLKPLGHPSVVGAAAAAPEAPSHTGADDGSRTRNLPVDSRLLRYRAPSASGQPGRIRTSDCSFVGCHDHPFHHGPVGWPAGLAPASRGPRPRALLLSYGQLVGTAGLEPAFSSVRGRRGLHAPPCPGWCARRESHSRLRLEGPASSLLDDGRGWLGRQGSHLRSPG